MAQIPPEDRSPAWLPAYELARLIARRELSPVEVMRAALDRIERVEPALHAFLTVCADDALAAARAREAEVMRGDSLGPLHGIPVAVKDEAWTAGVRTTAGSRLFEDFVPDRDAAVIERLKAAGAIVIGKTNTPEFMGLPRTLNLLAPESRNPWDLSRISGASSGGSAAALAAGLAPLALGSDGGGSIRIPAALCGVQGLFPTPGRVPDTGSFSYSKFGSMGPMARSTRDLALMYSVMAGPDGVDRRLDEPAPDVWANFEAGVEGMRFAWTPDFGHVEVDPEVARIAGAAARRLERAGAIVEAPNLVLPDAWSWFRNMTYGDPLYGEERFTPYLRSESFLEMARRPENLARLTERAAAMVSAPAVTRQEYDDARGRLTRVEAQFAELFGRYDALLSPTLPVIAPVARDGVGDLYPVQRSGTFFTSLANLALLPGLSTPCGFHQGLPVGLQVICPTRREDRVLRIGRTLEQLLADEVAGKHPPLQMSVEA